MIPTFGEEVVDGAELKCPACGGNYLHHEIIEIWDRVEDANDGLHIIIKDGKTLIDTDDFAGNPSLRRHGLTITFSCEGCPAKPVLSFAQHKGNTVVDFRKGKKGEEEK